MNQIPPIEHAQQAIESFWQAVRDEIRRRAQMTEGLDQLQRAIEKLNSL